MNVGIYIRLSDDDDIKKNNESESIKNQRTILNNYVKEHGFNLIDEYVDDGYTGLNFERPSFKRMLEDIEKGIIDCVIVKDQSRLGRDYIGVGKLLEKYFPLKNIRFISVLDNYDSFERVNEDIIPFKALLNDMTSKDTSKKVRSALIAKMKKGQFIGSRAPYGYKKDPNDKNHLIIDFEVSNIVKRIFEDYANGKGQEKIAKELTKEGILTPINYKNGINVPEKNIWTSSAVSRILKNKAYSGALEQHRVEVINYKVKKKRNVKEPILVENTHEPIIEKEIFELVQNKLDYRLRESHKKYDYLLTGLMKCSDCNHAICVRTVKRKDGKINAYTYCTYFAHTHKLRCYSHGVDYFKLEKEILDNLKTILSKQLINYEEINNSSLHKKEENNKIIKDLTNKLILIERKQGIIYEDRLNSIISVDEYVKRNNEYEKQKKELNKRINELKVVKENNLNYNEIVDSIIKLEKPDKLILQKLIKVIYINKDKEIELQLNFVN